MPAEKRDLHLEFELLDCANWSQPEDLLETIKLITNLTGLIPLELKQRIKVGERQLAHPVANNLEEWFFRHYTIKQSWQPLKEGWETETLNGLDSKESFLGIFRIPLEEEWRTNKPLWGAVEIVVDAANYGELPSPKTAVSKVNETFNYIKFYCTLFGKSLIRSNYQLYRADDVANVFLKFAKPAIHKLRPAYALITDEFYCENSGQDVFDARLKFIYWCNYLGSSYVKKHGDDIFLSVPIGKAERVGEGVWYQMTERISDYWDRDLREQVHNHFSNLDIHVAGDIIYFG